jgi:polar amino acid transport system substrate-binding protein
VVTSWAHRLAIVAVLLLAAAACSSKEEAVPGGSLVEPGQLHVCTSPTRPPMQYRGHDGVLRGFEVDLFDAVAKEMDLDVVWVESPRAQVVRALADGECDVIASSLAVRWEDQLVVQEVEYLAMPISLLVRDGAVAPLSVGLCGQRVAAFAHTWEARILARYARNCRRQSKPAVTTVVVTSGDAALEQLRSGGVDGFLDDGPTSAWYAQRQTDSFDDGGTVPNEDVHYAFAVQKGKPDVFVAVRNGMFALYDDGRFEELLHRWGLDDKGVEGLPLYS